jgi:hypothetical protein
MIPTAPRIFRKPRPNDQNKMPETSQMATCMGEISKTGLKNTHF